MDVEGVKIKLSIDLNELPTEVDEQPEDNSQKGDVEVQEARGSSRVPGSDYFENLGFRTRSDTLICRRNTKVHFSGKSLYKLARSWFHGGFAEEEKHQHVGRESFSKPMGEEISKEWDKGKEKIDDEDADLSAFKEHLKGSMKKAKTRARNAKNKGKEVPASSASGVKRKKKCPKDAKLEGDICKVQRAKCLNLLSDDLEGVLGQKLVQDWIDLFPSYADRLVVDWVRLLLG